MILSYSKKISLHFKLPPSENVQNPCDPGLLPPSTGCGIASSPWGLPQWPAAKQTWRSRSPVGKKKVFQQKKHVFWHKNTSTYCFFQEKTRFCWDMFILLYFTNVFSFRKYIKPPCFCWNIDKEMPTVEILGSNMGLQTLNCFCFGHICLIEIDMNG